MPGEKIPARTAIPARMRNKPTIQPRKAGLTMTRRPKMIKRAAKTVDTIGPKVLLLNVRFPLGTTSASNFC